MNIYAELHKTQKYLVLIPPLICKDFAFQSRLDYGDVRFWLSDDPAAFVEIAKDISEIFEIPKVVDISPKVVPKAPLTDLELREKINSVDGLERQTRGLVLLRVYAKEPANLVLSGCQRVRNGHQGMPEAYETVDLKNSTSVQVAIERVLGLSAEKWNASRHG